MQIVSGKKYLSEEKMATLFLFDEEYHLPPEAIAESDYLKALSKYLQKSTFELNLDFEFEEAWNWIYQWLLGQPLLAFPFDKFSQVLELTYYFQIPSLMEYLESIILGNEISSENLLEAFPLYQNILQIREAAALSILMQNNFLKELPLWVYEYFQKHENKTLPNPDEWLVTTVEKIDTNTYETPAGFLIYLPDVYPEIQLGDYIVSKGFEVDPAANAVYFDFD
jgi:hypothetical protein